MPEYRILVGGESPGLELRRLAQWVRQDSAIRTGATIELKSAPTVDGEMGSGLELISLITQTGFSAANLLLAVSSWRRSRPSAPVVTIERGGTRVILESGDSADVERIAELVRVLGNE